MRRSRGLVLSLLVLMAAPALGKVFGVPREYRYLDYTDAAPSQQKHTSRATHQELLLPMLQKGRDAVVNISVSLPEESIHDETEHLNFATAWFKVYRYASLHQKFATDALMWLIFGQVLAFIGIFLIIFSEIRMVLAVRAQDARKALAGDQRSANPAAEEREREEAAAEQRPFLTAAGCVSLGMGGVLFLAPFCGMLYLFGLPAEGIGSWPCYLTIFLGVAFGTICISLFMVGIMWSCTRPWAALLLLVVAVMGNLLIATFNPLLIMLWMGASSGLLYWYFEWYPDWCKESNAPRPDWCQGMGPVELEWDITAWGNSFQGAQKSLYQDVVKRVVPESALRRFEGEGGGEDGEDGKRDV